MSNQYEKFTRAVRTTRGLILFSVGLFGSGANAAITTYTDRVAFEAAVSDRQTIDFSTTNTGLPLTIPSNQPIHMENWTRSGVTFDSFYSYSNLQIEMDRESKLTVTLPVNTKAFGADLGFHLSTVGTYVITLPNGDLLTTYTSGAGMVTFFGLVSDEPIEWAEFSFDSDTSFPDTFVMDNFTFQSQCVIRPDGTSGWWPFDDLDGPLSRDISGNDNHGDWYSPMQGWGLPEAIPGRIFGALRFPDFYEYFQEYGVTVPATPSVNIGDDFSFVFWLRPQEEMRTSQGAILEKRSLSEVGKGYMLWLSNGKPVLFLGTPTQEVNFASNGPAIEADGSWHFLVVTVNRSKSDGLKFYVDGAPHGTSGNPTGLVGPFSNTSPLRIGYASHPVGSYAGGIDELMLVHRALSADEVTRLYQAPVGVCR